MKATFWVTNEKAEEVKSDVRKYMSLRFLNNPIKVGNAQEFRIEGNVQDFDLFFRSRVFQKENKPKS